MAEMPRHVCPLCLHVHQKGVMCGKVELGGGFSQDCYCVGITAPAPLPPPSAPNG